MVKVKRNGSKSVPGSKAFSKCVLSPHSGTSRLGSRTRQERTGAPEPCGPPLIPTPDLGGLVREQAGEGFSQVADSLGLGLVFTGSPALRGVGGTEAVGQGLRFAETQR